MYNEIKVLYYITYLPFFLYRIEITIRMIMTLTIMFIRVTPITIPATVPLFKPVEMYIN